MAPRPIRKSAKRASTSSAKKPKNKKDDASSSSSVKKRKTTTSDNEPQPEEEKQPRMNETGTGTGTGTTDGNTGTAVDVGVIDSEANIEGGVIEELDNDPCDAMLVMVDRSKNIDKFYIIQFILSTSYVVYTRWGRTGTVGQTSTQDFDYNYDEAVKCFRNKFKEKTGLLWENRNNQDSQNDNNGKYYRYIKQNLVAKQCGFTNAKWQYYVDDGVDGKGIGWYDYTDTGSAQAERLYQEHQYNDRLTNRLVESGYFTYDVNLLQMTQTNATHPNKKCRHIRRVVDNDTKEEEKEEIQNESDNNNNDDDDADTVEAEAETEEDQYEVHQDDIYNLVSVLEEEKGNYGKKNKKKKKQQWEYVPAPTTTTNDDGIEKLQPGTVIVYLFTTGWAKGVVQDMKIKKPSKQQKIQMMEYNTPYMIRYDDGYWPHDLGDTSYYLSKQAYDELVSLRGGRGGNNKKRKKPDHDITAGCWFIVKSV